MNAHEYPNQGCPEGLPEKQLALSKHFQSAHLAAHRRAVGWAFLFILWYTEIP